MVNSSQRSRRRLLSVLALLVMLVGALAVPVASASAKPGYVALGDSFTAGPLIPLQIPPLGCLKSNRNYPHLSAPSFRTQAFRDASCSGARTAHMTQTQNVEPGPNPPQFDSLDADTRIVSVGIGGNDIGFSEIIRNCTSRLTPEGHPCQDRYVVNGEDEISARISRTAPRIDGVLDGIRARAPKSQTYLVNYLPILPETGDGCWPQVPVARDDVPYLRAKQQELNQMLATQAAANGATLVDAYSAGIGHDACKLPVQRWVEPEEPVSAAAPYHPNLGGMEGTARVLKAAVSTR